MKFSTCLVKVFIANTGNTATQSEQLEWHTDLPVMYLTHPFLYHQQFLIAMKQALLYYNQSYMCCTLTGPLHKGPLWHIYVFPVS